LSLMVRSCLCAGDQAYQMSATILFCPVEKGDSGLS
jgi:hypothetical protein